VDGEMNDEGLTRLALKLRDKPGRFGCVVFGI